MRVLVLHNAHSGSAARLDAVRALLPHAEFHALDAPPDWANLAGRYDRVVVAGGDGTIHRVLNELAKHPMPHVAVLPLGTGNDFCRTLGVPLDAAEAVSLVEGGRERRIDLISVTGDFTGVLANAATGGFSGQVARDVTHDLKQAWGPLAYLRGALPTAVDPPTYRVRVRLDGGRWHQYAAINVVVANGRTAAGGLRVAPTANIEDGKLDLILVLAAGTLDLAIAGARLMAGDYHADANVLHRRGRTLELTAEPPLPMSLDGETATGSKFTFAVRRGALPVRVGPAYRKHARPLPSRLFHALAAGLRLARGAWMVALPFAAFVLLGLLVEWGAFDAANPAVAAALRPADASPPREFAAAATFLGHTGVVLAALLLVALQPRRHARPLLLAGLLLAVIPLEYAAKWAYGVERPHPLGALLPAGEYSYPSGHALRATVVGGLLAAVPRRGNRWLGLLAVAPAAVVCWTRVALGVHWPTDVAGGVLLGLAVLGLHQFFIRHADAPG